MGKSRSTPSPRLSVVAGREADARPSVVPVIHVLAGVNGAGKSSIGGATFRAHGGDYFNPDESARRLMAANARLSQAEANGLAWQHGKRLLERAIDKRLDYAFETTLGAHTMPRLLGEAAAAGFAVKVWYVGLSTPEQHVARVQARVRRGGHDIPEEKIRQRFVHSRLNLIELLPRLAVLRLYDNSVEADPTAGIEPRPQLLLHLDRGRVVAPADLSATPDWARPIVAAALKRVGTSVEPIPIRSPRGGAR